MKKSRINTQRFFLEAGLDASAYREDENTETLALIERWLKGEVDLDSEPVEPEFLLSELKIGEESEVDEIDYSTENELPKFC